MRVRRWSRPWSIRALSPIATAATLLARFPPPAALSTQPSHVFERTAKAQSQPAHDSESLLLKAEQLRKRRDTTCTRARAHALRSARSRKEPRSKPCPESQ